MDKKEECRCFYTETDGHTPIVDSRGFCKHGVKVGMDNNKEDCNCNKHPMNKVIKTLGFNKDLHLESCDNNKEEVESFPGINSTSQSSMNPEFYAPQSPVSEYYWESIKQIVDKYNNVWNLDMVSDLEVILFEQRQEAYEEGKKAENERLEKKAKEYKEKGFELETFIYSGFVEDLPKIDTIDIIEGDKTYKGKFIR